jgi:chaperonin GroES
LKINTYDDLVNKAQNLLFSFALIRRSELAACLLANGDTNMGLKPLGDRIIVQRQSAEEKTAGGILLPDTAKNKPQRGKVLAVGPGKQLKDGSRRPLQVKEGDIVLFTAWAGDEFKDRGNDQEILVMHEEDVLAVIE